MRFIIFSDLHGYPNNLRKALNIHSNADAVIFLGDGINTFKTETNHLNIPVYAVKGNCDIGSNEKDTDYITYKNNKILITHGHKYHVKYSLEDIILSAKQNDCNIILFGHTHTALSKYENGLHIINPGTVSSSPNPTYAILDITDKGIISNIVNI